MIRELHVHAGLAKTRRTVLHGILDADDYARDASVQDRVYARRRATEPRARL